jgi:hypothetical protein
MSAIGKIFGLIVPEGSYGLIPIKSFVPSFLHFLRKRERDGRSFLEGFQNMKYFLVEVKG